jgi:nucleotide-binding universal stress UspA family protein
MPARGLRTARSNALVAVVPAVLLALAGCSAAENAVSEATQSAKAGASSAVSDAAGNAVRDQICRLVRDGNVSEADLEQLQQLVDRAGEAGVPESVLGPARDLAKAGGDQGAAQIETLQQRCAAA